MFDPPFIDNIRQFFFKAMIEGWAAGSEKVAIPQLPCYKAIEHKEGYFHLIDCWCKNPGTNGSSGFTTIYWKDNPVWTMQYGGLYLPGENVMDFLKNTILQAYKEKRFYGGRGPQSRCNAGLIYINTISRNNFDQFSGREAIYNTRTGQCYGHHEYSGMAFF